MSDSDRARGPDRRAFLRRSVTAASAAALGCRPDAGGDTAPLEGGARELDPEILLAAATVALPSELGPEGIERATRGFTAWLAGYAPVSERVHGYGSQEIRYGPPDPAPRWGAQLDALDREARARTGTAFAALDPDGRRELLAGALADAGGPLPDRPGALEAEHVVVGLLGWFYGSPEATDLCYGRRIDPLSCRPLSASADLPPPLGTDRDGGAAPVGAVARSPRARRTADPAAAPERGLEPGS